MNIIGIQNLMPCFVNWFLRKLCIFFEKNCKMPPKSAKAPVPFDPKTQMVVLKLEGGDHEFFVDRQCACLSGHIKDRIESRLNSILCSALFLQLYTLIGDYTLNENEIPVITIDVVSEIEVMEKVIQYLYYKNRYDNEPDKRPTFEIPDALVLQLMVAAHSLKT